MDKVEGLRCKSQHSSICSFVSHRRAGILKPMWPHPFRFIFAALLTFGAFVFVGGCKSHGDPFNMSARAAAWNASKSSARQELTEIPLPSKSTYLTIDQSSRWLNPFVTVESNMIQVRIYMPDENSSPVDRGGLTRLSSARKQILNVRPKDLPRALVALPDAAWPYGRVVAVGEEIETPQNRTRLRSNLAITIGALKDMDIIVDDWSGRGLTP